MKKILLLAIVVGFTTTSCKKDRVCSCKDVTTISGGPAAGAFSQDYEYTILDSGRKTAYYHCTHKQSTETENGVTVVFDSNCSLK